jgi:hypothetical protein
MLVMAIYYTIAGPRRRLSCNWGGFYLNLGLRRALLVGKASQARYIKSSLCHSMRRDTTDVRAHTLNIEYASHMLHFVWSTANAKEGEGRSSKANLGFGGFPRQKKARTNANGHERTKPPKSRTFGCIYTYIPQKSSIIYLLSLYIALFSAFGQVHTGYDSIQRHMLSAGELPRIRSFHCT